MTANKRVTGADNEQRATEYLIDNGYSEKLLAVLKIRLCSRSCQLQKAADNTTGCNVLSYNKIQKL